MSCFAVFFTFLLAQSTYAQSYLGVHAGINSGKFSGDSPSKFRYSSAAHYEFGLDFHLFLDKDLYLTMAPSFSEYGSKLQYPKMMEDGTEQYADSIQLNLQMLAIPLFLEIISNNNRFAFSGGFEAAVPLQLVADNSVDRKEIKDELNTVNFSMLFGIAYRIPIQRQYLQIGLTYAQGLTNIAQNLSDPDALMPRVRLSSFRLTANWQLPVGKTKE